MGEEMIEGNVEESAEEKLGGLINAVAAEIEADEELKQKLFETNILVTVNSLVRSPAPEVVAGLEVDVLGDPIQVNITVGEESKDDVGLLIGPKWRNITLVKQYLRNQRLIPHDKDIKVVINKPDGTQEISWDKAYRNRRKTEE